MLRMFRFRNSTQSHVRQHSSIGFPDVRMASLKNGSTANQAKISAVQLKLRDLFASDPKVCFQLWQQCKKPQYQLMDGAEKVIKNFGFDELDEEDRNIIEASIKGQTINDMKLIDPTQDEDFSSECKM